MSKVVELGSKLKSIEKIRQSAEAMQVVAVAQLKKAQAGQRAAARYKESYDRLAAKVGLELKPLRSKAGAMALVYVFASEKGFCGSFNQGLAAAVQTFVHGKKVAGQEPRLVVLGSKGSELFPGAAASSDSPLALAEAGAKLYVEGEVKGVYLCYNEFKSMLVQQPVCRQLLPFAAKAGNLGQALIEPSLKSVQRFVTINYLKAVFYDAFMQARLGEVSARLMTMRGATESAKDLLAELRIKFNKARQSMITVELSEIVSSFEILNEGVG